MPPKGDSVSIRNVYKDITSYETILRAEKHVAAGNQYDPEVLMFRSNYEENIYDLVHLLRAGEIPPTSYHHFYVHSPKVRKVIYIDYASKIVQRAIYDIVNPLVCRSLITHTYSCIEGRGQLSAMQDLKKWLEYSVAQGGTWYYYKYDVEKFFYRMDHDVLMSIVEDWIGDRSTVKLISHYVTEAPIPFGLPLGLKSPVISQDQMIWDKGIPIGGGLSHMLANMYLNELDQKSKRQLRIKPYTRYMDDVVCLSNDKSQIHDWRDWTEEYLLSERKLTLNRRTALRPIGQGIEYVGYRIWPKYVTLRKGTTLRMKRNLSDTVQNYSEGNISFDRARQTFASYEAMMSHCDCKELEEKIWKTYILRKINSNVEEEPWIVNSLYWNLLTSMQT